MPLTSPVPSRSAMISRMQGDPFLGALLPALGGLVARAVPAAGRFIGGLFKGGSKLGPSVGASRSVARGVPAGSSRSTQVARASSVGSSLIRQGLGGAAVGAGIGTISAALSQFTGFDDVPRRRRRMNPLNPKALRRATRRLASFNKMAKKTQAELAKLAPPRARRAPPRSTESHRATVTHDR